ncbi:MAG: STAS domain-containing protein, partial [Clostridia bacterium]|nr:STAS domain-containing protein [Clostridia bacterium]
DMEGVGFMDSAGIGVILGRYRRLSARRGSMNVVNARKNVERILRMSGVYKLCTERSGK